MKYEEVCKSLLSDFPDIEKWEDDSELSSEVIIEFKKHKLVKNE